MKKKNLIVIGIIALVILIATILIISLSNKKDEDSPMVTTDSKKFSKEYTEIDKNNPFVYRSIEDIIKILQNGTGLVYLGFPECPWCQEYVKYLNEIAQDMAVSKIYYYNILEDRKNNTEEYKKIVAILEDYLQYDEEGNKKLYVPSVIAVNKGKIVGFDDETAWDTKGFEKPKDYWTEAEITELKDRLQTMISASDSNICTDCNS